MTDKDRIKRLEQMVKSLAETVHSLTQIINTGSYEYHLSDIRIELSKIEEYKGPEWSAK